MGKLFTDPAIERAVATLDWCVRRQRLITSNVVNRDTPGYRARDLDFKALMERIHGEGGAGVGLRRTDDRHLSASGGALSPDLIVKESSERLDGNSVNLSEEMARLTENNLTYQAVLKRLTRKFQGLKLAIQDGGSS
jgi:flagellar basal-body rod protein FlgB